MINYTLNRSNRKTLALYVRNGKVDVRAPLKLSKSDIDKFVLSKEKWITDKLAIASEKQEQRAAFSVNYGDMVLYLGKRYPIVVKSGSRVGFDGESFYMPPDMSPERIKSACVQVYRLLAKRDLTNKVLHFAKQMQVMPSAVKMSGATTRWGSCSSNRSLNFSWRLIMAEDAVVDYVVIHELAHITEMNHSERFWALVAGMLPDYKERLQRLKALQKKLSLEDWD
ncbi:MAG: M48 family metallopeptidase [Thermaerobacter sp.]|nr:M48 family metallopeptidase [Thermaerobacter sp.]